MHMRYHRQYGQVIFKAWQLFFVLTAFLLLARLVMFNSFVDATLLDSKDADVWRMWITGARYDMRVAAMVAAPVFLFGSLCAGWRGAWHYFYKIWNPILAISIFMVIFLTIINYFYYQTFHNHIDLFAFGILNDDTKAVVANAWQDYPVVKGIALTLALSVLVFYVGKLRLASDVSIASKPTVVFIWVLSFVLLFIAARGSVGTFPLRKGNAQVSDLLVLNRITPNAVMALDWAIKDYKADVNYHEVSIKDRDLLLEKVGLDSLYATTTKNQWLKDNPPHVVMALMESFGSNMLVMDDEQENDLLGELRDAFEQDIVFKRFVSEGNGTAPSLAALFFNSPAQNISHSSAQRTVLADTPFSTYKAAGYKVIFISPGNMMWRNLVNFLPLQGVDEVYDQNSLIDLFPAAKEQLTDWGIPDEYAFRLAKQLLEESEEPLFISILTVTNHPPYVVPDTYQTRPVAITDAVEKHQEEGQISQINILETFQYAADAFGVFIKNIKSSKLAEKTIIASTGDHQMRRVKAYYPEELMLDKAVPFYMFVPSQYKNRLDVHVDTSRAGSHKDIFPTLFNLSLSDTQYLARGGRNLLAQTDDASMAFGYNEQVWITAEGAYPLTGESVMYPWKEDSPWMLQSSPAPVDESEAVRQKSYQQLLRWQLNARVKGTN